MDYSLVVVGQLRRQYLIPPEGKPLLDVPGGNLLYAAAGVRLWEPKVSLMARVGEDYPHEWLRFLNTKGMNTTGIKILPGPLDLRSFRAYTDAQNFHRSNPVSHFIRVGQPFPKGLLGYLPPGSAEDSRSIANADSPRLSDIPAEYTLARGVHLAPLDLLTHTQMAPAFRHAGVGIVCMDPGASYMNPNFFNDMRSLLQGLTAFMPSEEQIRSLFWGRSTDLWEMAEALADFGCEMIVIRRGARGQYLYEHASHKKWEIPAYPSRLQDPTGAGDVFGGGFLAGMAASHDPLQAALSGNISASFSIEGSGAFYLLDCMPGLAQARLQSLRNLIRTL